MFVKHFVVPVILMSVSFQLQNIGILVLRAMFNTGLRVIQEKKNQFFLKGPWPSAQWFKFVKCRRHREHLEQLK